jgi:hypothetical protein
MSKVIEKIDIEARNREFQAMTPEQKRVAIAEDVIRYLNTKAIIAASGSYLKILNVPEKAVGTGIHTVIGSKECHACAIGSLFMASVGWRDGVNLDNRHRSSVDRAVRMDDDDGLMAHLQDVFTEGALRRIEMWFEGEEYGGFRFGGREADAASEFKDRFPNDEQRLRLIMANIVANNGKLIPEQLMFTGTPPQTSTDISTPSDEPLPT